MAFSAPWNSAGEKRSGGAEHGLGGGEVARGIIGGSAFAPVLQDILREQPEVHVIAYLDDPHILRELGHVRAAYDMGVPLLVDIGLELNIDHGPATAACGMAGWAPEAGNHVMPEGLQIPEEAPSWGRHLILDVVVGFPCALSFVERVSQEPLHTASVDDRQKAKNFLEEFAERRQYRV
ncbi:hypothetical protein CYMTET_5979 [Cymbomonas tetramitiformis]|uniref:Uncharacterized protein n=1 Tax=Cymbomonas tetramitiformis TaxID=36881 RepID=A0AAE0GY31_9CHLO|nr:hypothetical protein CYMTET_5979 [Cymbomonas tetramitiformis]